MNCITHCGRFCLHTLIWFSIRPSTQEVSVPRKLEQTQQWPAGWKLSQKTDRLFKNVLLALGCCTEAFITIGPIVLWTFWLDLFKSCNLKHCWMSFFIITWCHCNNNVLLYTCLDEQSKITSVSQVLLFFFGNLLLPGSLRPLRKVVHESTSWSSHMLS